MTEEEKGYEEISRKYVERATQYTKALQKSWKEAMDKAIDNMTKDWFKDEDKKDE